VSTNLIDGRSIGEQVHAETAQRISSLRARGIQPGLAFVRVGEDPASKVYVGMKEKMCRRMGIHSETHVLSAAATSDELLNLIARLNETSRLHGILIQAPLPRQIPPAAIYAAVAPSKDVDGFHPINMGKLLLGDTSGFVPCTPAGIQQLLIRSKIDIEGAHVVILGRGDIVGKPLAALLCQKAQHANATVTLCHSRTRDIGHHCRQADILVAALGAPHFVKADMIKPGATIMDVGVARIEDPSSKGGSRLVGDVDFSMVQPIAGRITPNPGGVGPMTIALLMHNTVRAAELSTAP
jgi:methylenetetrahydrofolate dehydrogenase (NADP+)/methenyltetrahydrofolate cyclohydrolase